jgi:hypothetical protein
MAPPRYSLTFRLVPGLRFSRARAVGFLEGHPDMNAAGAYASFGVTEQWDINRRMEQWALPSDTPERWFHGFPTDRICKECFVFKLDDHRLYGFLCNPLPKSDGRFRLCVLIIHATKHKWKTEPLIKRKIEQWRVHSAVKQAIAYTYDDDPKGGKQWTQ